MQRLDLQTREEVRDEQATEDEADCIFCECRPSVSYCGRYMEGPIDIGLWDDGEVCPDCLQVWESTGCPGCGCVAGRRCQRCEAAK